MRQLPVTSSWGWMAAEKAAHLYPHTVYLHFVFCSPPCCSAFLFADSFFTVLQGIIKSPIFHYVILFSSPLSALLLYPLICSNLHPSTCYPLSQRNQYRDISINKVWGGVPLPHRQICTHTTDIPRLFHEKEGVQGTMFMLSLKRECTCKKAQKDSSEGWKWIQPGRRC